MFKLDERLAADTVEITRWPLCRVLLMNDANYPWLVLVPARPDLRDVIDLPALERHTLMDEIARAGEALRAMFKPHKLNVASLGNQVAQLHVHVVARSMTDAAWPKPIWGVAPTRPYDAAALSAFKERFFATL